MENTEWVYLVKLVFVGKQGNLVDALFEIAKSLYKISVEIDDLRQSFVSKKFI